MQRDMRRLTVTYLHTYADTTGQAQEAATIIGSLSIRHVVWFVLGVPFGPTHIPVRDKVPGQSTYSRYSTLEWMMWRQSPGDITRYEYLQTYVPICVLLLTPHT